MQKTKDILGTLLAALAGVIAAILFQAVAGGLAYGDDAPVPAPAPDPDCGAAALVEYQTQARLQGLSSMHDRVAGEVSTYWCEVQLGEHKENPSVQLLARLGLLVGRSFQEIGREGGGISLSNARKLVMASMGRLDPLLDGIRAGLDGLLAIEPSVAARPELQALRDYVFAKRQLGSWRKSTWLMFTFAVEGSEEAVELTRVFCSWEKALRTAFPRSTYGFSPTAMANLGCFPRRAPRSAVVVP